MWTIAIGDIHGDEKKLLAILAVMKEWESHNANGKNKQLVFVGDYIDRGPDSRDVLRKVRELQSEGAVCLRGNHEDLMIRSADSELDRQSFLVNGGCETLRSLEAVEKFAEWREWMLSLPLSYQDELRYFVHAGIRPGDALDEQSTRDQMWIRDVFLAHQQPFDKYIVHGHSPIKSGIRLPDVRANRCDLDTGAGHGGPLSAAIFNDETAQPVWLLNSDGEIVAV